MTPYEQAIQRAEDAKQSALAVYAFMREFKNGGLWQGPRYRRYEQLRQMAHSMSMRHADLLADAQRIKASEARAA